MEDSATRRIRRVLFGGYDRGEVERLLHDEDVAHREHVQDRDEKANDVARDAKEARSQLADCRKQYQRLDEEFKEKSPNLIKYELLRESLVETCLRMNAILRDADAKAKNIERAAARDAEKTREDAAKAAGNTVSVARSALLSSLTELKTELVSQRQAFSGDLDHVLHLLESHLKGSVDDFVSAVERILDSLSEKGD